MTFEELEREVAKISSRYRINREISTQITREDRWVIYSYDIGVLGDGASAEAALEDFKKRRANLEAEQAWLARMPKEAA